ncbi:F510_1955 family glycosylhydrolase [Arthrobacter sp. Helios]|uniref:F510_1955 family glycosylhydrolase n=1 Tax=Arthrobacter sp. Helios TaxID=2828862 RepID=UPI0020624E3A|nr:exo-alpha-sialidase [Arthrobacter sp. Helios]UPO78030.1 exo-alpha-sialidase [Arthrobacter sp. Helios]
MRLGFSGRSGAAAAVVLLALTACSSPAGSREADASPPFPSHVHALALKPGTTDVIVASHEGIFEVSGSELHPTGTNIDLMGFAVAGNGDYLASGHPGPGVDLPEPAGLIRSTDGESWSVESLGGESDFHALAVTGGGIIGFDGTLRLSRDGGQWTDSQTQLTPYNLAGSPSGTLAVATTEAGPYRSQDAGLTWSAISGAPVIMLAAVTDQSRIVGVLPDGGIVTSEDQGGTWVPAGKVSGYPVAVTAAETVDGLQIWVMTDAGLEHSADGGQSFSTIVGLPAQAP